MARTIFAMVVTILFVVVGMLYFVLYTPYLVQSRFPALWAKYVPSISLDSFKVKGQKIEYPKVLKLFDVSAQVTLQNQIYAINVEEIDILDFIDLWQLRQQARIEFFGLNVTRANMELKKAQGKVTILLQEDPLEHFEGQMQAEQLLVNPYELNNLKVQWTRSPDAWHIPQWQIQAYGGEAEGSFDLVMKPYDNELFLANFRGINMKDLRPVNEKLFGQMEGYLSGNMRMNRINKEIQVLGINAEIANGVVISSSLARRMSSFMTSENARDQIQVLTDHRQRLELDSLGLRFQNINPRLIAVTFILNNQSQKLNVQETVNMDIERLYKKVAWKI